MIVNTKENREQYIKRADDRVQLFFKSSHKYGCPLPVLNVNWQDEDVLGFVFAGPEPLTEEAEDDAAWDEVERRMDVIGNDGEHYSIDDFEDDLDKIEEASKADDVPEDANMKDGPHAWRPFEDWRKSHFPESINIGEDVTLKDGETLAVTGIFGKPVAVPGELKVSVLSKYHKEIKPGVHVDVYDVLKAFDVTNPALQHLIKKALKPGDRGHKDLMTDMTDIIDSAVRAKELEK